MTRYGQTVNEKNTPQHEKAKPSQVKNNAGGYVFEVGPWKQLDRFLILGQVGPTYYASERKVVKENADVIAKCIAEDGLRVVKRIVEFSDQGRAPKNDPAIFALAMAAGSKDIVTRKAALDALPKVCRIGTHLFHFAADVSGFRRWGRGLRGAIAKWYTERNDDSLAMQAVKYQQRDGWSHRDLLRLSHAKPKTLGQGAAFRWMTGGIDALGKESKRGKVAQREDLPKLIVGYEELRTATDVKDVIRLVTEYKLPREAIPTQWLNEKKVWEALLPHMGLTAMVRNLAKMTAIGLLTPMGSSTKIVTSRLTNAEAIKSERVHPMQFLLASGVYAQGHGEKGKLTWNALREVRDALDAGFYAAFKTIEPTGKNTLIALDVSGSMHGGNIAGAPGITPAIASAAMAMVTMRAEKTWHLMGFSHRLIRLDNISANDSLETVVKKITGIPFGSTDCALPMLYAAGEDIDVDVFQVYTDNETWHGNTHPFQALKAYRSKSGRKDAKLVVCGLTATEFTIADPSDPGMLDVVGMDSHAPSLMADFARGML